MTVLALNFVPLSFHFLNPRSLIQWNMEPRCLLTTLTPLFLNSELPLRSHPKTWHGMGQDGVEYPSLGLVMLLSIISTTILGLFDRRIAHSLAPNELIPMLYPLVE